MRKTSRVKNGIASFFKYFFMIFLIFISLAPIIWAFLGSLQGADVRHLPAPAGTGVPEDERVQLSPVQPLPHSLEGGDDGLRLQGPAGAGLIDRLLQLLQHLGQLAVREQASVGEDQNPSPFPSRSAAPAAQVLMSPRPTRPSRVR